MTETTTRSVMPSRNGWLTLAMIALATVGTIRLRLFKVAARVVRSVRRIWFHVASGWPGRDLFRTIHRALARAPA